MAKLTDTTEHTNLVTVYLYVLSRYALDKGMSPEKV